MSMRPNIGKSWTSTLLAFMIYQALAILWFGTPVLSDFSHTYIGFKMSTDPAGYMWFLKWWPYAITHRLNPFLPKVIWAPGGFNATWAASIPLPALVAAPITQGFGPVAAWNLWCLLSPALAAWCAFLLCRHLCGSSLPALVGGYLFGFSPYVLGHLLGHLSLILIFPVPLAVLVAILRAQSHLSALRFVSLLTILALVIFLCCQELLAAVVAIGGITITAIWLAGNRNFNGGLISFCGLIAIALAFTAILLGPYLYYAFLRGFPRGPINPSDIYSSDLLALFVPSQTLLIARPAAINAVAERLVGGAAEDTAYLGVPLLLMILDYGISNWREARARGLVLTLALIVLASFGPQLHVEGKRLFPLPWAVAAHLPLLDKALPSRFMMFAFLDTGVIAAIYLASPPHRTRKWLLALLVVISLIPNLPAGWWVSRTDTPAFFSNGIFRRYMEKDEIALILPYASEGNSMLWQAQSDIYFRMAGGYVGITPQEFLRWPVLDSLYSGEPCFDFTDQLGFFLAAHEVRTIILAHDARRSWPALLAPRYLTSHDVDDVALYRISPVVLAEYGGVTAHEAAMRQAERAFAALAEAANDYWTKGLALQKLTPWEAQRLGLLPLPGSGTPANPAYPQWWHNLWLGAVGRSSVGIGFLGNYEDLKPEIDTYAPFAKEIRFPFPDKYRAERSTAGTGLLLMTFDRAGLARAAALTGTPKWR